MRVLLLALVAVAAAKSVVTVNAPRGRDLVRKGGEVWTRAEEDARGIVRENWSVPRPQDYVTSDALPTSFTWGDVNGTNFLTKSLNQHIPQYCGSCWAHGAISALGDRIKIARKAEGIDINLSIQYILNCGTAGSCHGGSATGTYEFIHGLSSPKGVPFDTCNPYLACSSESHLGICKDGDWSCSAENVCRTCSTFPPQGSCSAIDEYPNATISEYGEVRGEEDMMKEIYTRGPIAAGIDATKILNYHGGITGKGAGCEGIDHIISIVGWGEDNGQKYWIVRNSWGEYWGEMGYVRVDKGNNALCLESSGSWATPKAWTVNNFPCDEGGDNCHNGAQAFEDPFHADTHPIHKVKLH